MKEDQIDQLFNNIEQDFNLEEPTENHEKRFLKKLNQQEVTIVAKPKNSFWKPLLSIAATIALLVSVYVTTSNNNKTHDLASISPEMAETQNFFTTTIASELTKLEKETNPEAKILIQDAMLQIIRLEKQYTNLKEDLLESGDDKRVIYAIISNFQNRIDILQNTLKQIENIKQLKNNYHANTTI